MAKYLIYTRRGTTMKVAKARVIQETTVKAPKRIWDNYKVIGEAQKSDRIKLVVAAAIRDGVKYINIREFYLRQRDNEWRPGKDGITVPISIPINKGTDIIFPYDVFNTLLSTAAKELKDMPLYDSNNAIYYVREEKKI
jgi:hypothetical protein